MAKLIKKNPYQKKVVKVTKKKLPVIDKMVFDKLKVLEFDVAALKNANTGLHGLLQREFNKLAFSYWDLIDEFAWHSLPWYKKVLLNLKHWWNIIVNKIGMDTMNSFAAIDAAAKEFDELGK